MTAYLIVLGLAILTYLLIKLKKILDLHAIVDKIAGPPAWPLIGNILEIPWDPSDFFDNGYAYAKKYVNPDMFRLWIAWKPIIFLTGAEEAEFLLSSTKHINKGDDYRFLHPWLGLGLLTSYAEPWKPRRKLLTPTFHYDILKDFVEVFNSQAKIMVKKMIDTVGQGPRDYYQYVTLCALDIICETSMGRSVNAQGNNESDYVKAVYEINDIVHKRMRSPWFWNDWTFKYLGRGKQCDWCLSILHGFTHKVIKERQEARLKEVEKPKRLAFLDLLLEMADTNKISLKDIREEVDTFMFEGHDTTAAAMNWALHLIGCYPNVQDKIIAELDSVFGTDTRDITVEDLKQLVYLECCIKEALRLFPSVPIYARKIGEDFHIGDKLIPAGCEVCVLPFMVHRNHKHWENPDEFDPDRFLPENTSGRHPYAYVPFSAGSRNCIGQRFAIMEEKTVLATVFRSLKVKSVKERKDVRLTAELILRPSKPVPLMLEKRSNA